jgi:hypothetical protein
MMGMRPRGIGAAKHAAKRLGKQPAPPCAAPLSFASLLVKVPAFTAPHQADAS